MDFSVLNKINFSDFSTWYQSALNSGGTILIDKDTEWTSFDVVAKLRSILKIRKIGHAGTLDPRATGLLIVCCGKATKTIDSYQGLMKTYHVFVKLGATTKSFDGEFEEENLKNILSTFDEITDVIQSFIGTQEQIPPIFSAKKIKGKKLYNYARKGQEIEIKPSIVEIYSISDIQISLPFVEFDIKCSKGTYIRSLANDIGVKLGCGAYLHSLRRLKIGEYDVADAIKIKEMAEQIVTNIIC